MDNRVYYIDNSSKAMETVSKELSLRGLTVTQTPSKAVTHLVLGTPCRMKTAELEQLLERVPADIRIFGGFLDRLELQKYRCNDLLKDEIYLAKNASITAHCAIRVAMEHLSVTLEHCPVLILGGGRISQCLTQLIKGLGAEVVVAMRNDRQRATLQSLGYETETLPLPEYILPRFRVIFNTVPAPMLSARALENCRKDCVKIELASFPGLEGDGIINARGLPGRMAPESSGKLIARTVLRLGARKEETP